MADSGPLDVYVECAVCGVRGVRPGVRRELIAAPPAPPRTR